MIFAKTLSYKTSNLEIRTQKVWFGSRSQPINYGTFGIRPMKTRAKPNLLGTNFHGWKSYNDEVFGLNRI